MGGWTVRIRGSPKVGAERFEGKLDVKLLESKSYPHRAGGPASETAPGLCEPCTVLWKRTRGDRALTATGGGTPRNCPWNVLRI